MRRVSSGCLSLPVTLAYTHIALHFVHDVVSRHLEYCLATQNKQADPNLECGNDLWWLHISGGIIIIYVVVLLPLFIAHKVRYMLNHEEDIWEDDDWQFKYQNVVFPFKRRFAYAFIAIHMFSDVLLCGLGVFLRVDAAIMDLITGVSLGLFFTLCLVLRPFEARLDLILQVKDLVTPVTPIKTKY